MTITVRTGAALKSLLGEKQEARAKGTTVGEILESLDVRDRICAKDDTVRRHFNIHINEGEDVRLLQGLDTPLKDGDVVTILSAIAGGSGSNRKFWLTFPSKLVERPLIWEVGQRFEVVTNIRQASVTKDLGIVGLQISGEESEIEAAISFITDNGVSVEPVELDVVE